MKMLAMLVLAAAATTAAAEPATQVAAAQPMAKAAEAHKPAPAEARKPAVAGAHKPAAKQDPPHTVDGRPLILVGEGERVRDGETLYKMEMWVDEQDGKRAFPALAMRAGGRDKSRLTRGDHAPAFLIWGHFTKQAVLTFARAVPAATMRDDVKSALTEVRGADELLALFEDAAAGDQWLVTAGDNGQIALTIGGKKKEAPQSPRLVRALWEVWLGNKPLSPELRHGLIEHIDVLGK